MSGTPTQDEINTQFKNSVAILEAVRALGDDTLADPSGLYDVLERSVAGRYTPSGLAQAAQSHRSSFASLLSQDSIRSFLDPIFLEYAALIDRDGGGDTYGGVAGDPSAAAAALYEFMVANSQTVESRNLTFGTPALDGSAVGNGTLSRLYTDAEGYDIEACTVEKKHFRCISDQNSGASEVAEVFEVLGSRESDDGLLTGVSGSGLVARLRNSHAGSGGGSSILLNSSFDNYSASATNVFSNWVLTGTGITSEEAAVYNTHPGQQTARALEITGSGGGTVTLTQALSGRSGLVASRPYFCRAMVRADEGTAASGGNFVMRLGSQTRTVAISALSAGWNEIAFPLDENSWFRNWNEDDLTMEIEWAGGTSGTLLVDDVLLVPMTQIDGTWWVLRQAAASPTPWKQFDEITVTDSFAGSFGDGLLQYYTVRAYGRHLPHAGSPTITDPS